MGFRSELADVLSQVLLLARHHGVDLEAEVERKWMPWHPDRFPARSGSRTADAAVSTDTAQGAGGRAEAGAVAQQDRAAGTVGDREAAARSPLNSGLGLRRDHPGPSSFFYLDIPLYGARARIEADGTIHLTRAGRRGRPCQHGDGPISERSAMVDAVNGSAITAFMAALVVAGVLAASAAAEPRIETSGGLTRPGFLGRWRRGARSRTAIGSAAPTCLRSRLAPRVIGIAMYR